MSLPYRLIASDIDGTLVHDERNIPPRTRQVLAELLRRGAAVVLNTARPPRAVWGLHRQLGLADPIIAGNGALVMAPGQAAPLLHRPVDRGVAVRVVETLRALYPHLNLGLELADEWHVDRIDERLRARLDAGLVVLPPIVGDVDAAVRTSPRGVSKVYFIAPAEVRRSVERVLAARGLDRHLHITSSGSDFVEMMAAGVDKGSGLLALAGLLGVPREQTLAIGDGENDIPALQAAGLGIAMGRAAPDVQQAADAVAPVGEDGWAAAMERFVLNA